MGWDDDSGPLKLCEAHLAHMSPTFFHQLEIINRYIKEVAPVLVPGPGPVFLAALSLLDSFLNCFLNERGDLQEI